eukprot:g5895.t1
MSTQSRGSGFVSAQRVRELRDVAKAGTPSPTKRPPVLKSRAGVDPDMIFVGETPDFIYLVDSVGNVLIDDELRLVQPDDVTWSAEGKVQVRKKKEGADASTVETRKGPLLSDVVNVIAKDYAQSVKHSKKYLGYAPTVLSGGFQTRPVTVGNAKGLWAEGLFADYEEESEARLAKSIQIMRAEEKKRKNNPNTHLSPQKKKLHSEKFWRDITLENQARTRAATFAYHVQQNPDVSELHQVAPDWMRHGKLSEWDEYRFYQSHAPDGSPKSYPALASEHVKYFHDVPLTKKVLQADVRAREEGEQARMRERARLMAQEHAAAEMRAAQAAGKPSDFASVLDDKGARVDVRTGKKKEDTTTNDNDEDGQEVDPSSLLSATSFFQAGFSPKSHMLPLSAMAPASNNKQRPLSQDPNMLRQTSGIGGGNKTDFRHERRLSSVQRRFHESARAFPGHMVANMAAEDLIRMDSKLRALSDEQEDNMDAVRMKHAPGSRGQGPLQPRASRRPDGTAFYKRVVNAAGEFGRDAMWNRNDKTTLQGRNLKIALQSYAHEPGAADRLREVIYTRAKAKPRPPRGTAELGNEIVGGGGGLDAEDAFYGGGNVGAYEVESALAPAGGDVGMRSTADVDRAGGQQEASGGGIGGTTPSAPEAPRRKSRKSVSRPSTSTQPLAASYITPPAEGTRDFSRTEPHEALPEPLQATTSEAESQKSAKSAAAASNASGVWNVNEDVGGAGAVPFGGNFSFLHQSNKHVPRRSAVQQQAPSASRRSSGTTSSSVGAATPSGASSVKSAGGEGTNKASVPSIFVAAPPESAAEAAVDEVEADPDVEDEVNMLNVSDQASSRSSRAPSTQLVKVQPLDSVSAMDEHPQSQMDELADEKAKASTATGVSRGSGVSGAPELEASTRTSAAQNVVGQRSSSTVSERAASAQVPAARPSTGLRIDARDGQPVTYNAWLLKYPWDDFEEAAQFWLHMEPVMPAPIAAHAEVRESHIAAAAPQATTTGAVTGSGSEDESAGPGTSSSTRGRAGAGGEPLRDASQGTTSHDVYSRAASSVSQATTPAQAPTTLDASVPQEGSHRRTSKDKSSIDAALLQSGLLQKHQDPLPPAQNVKTATSALGSARTASAPTSAPPRPQTVIDQEAAVSDLFHSRLHAYSRMGYEQQAAEAAGTPGAFGYAGADVDFGDVQQRVEDADALRSDEMSERDRMNAMAARARNFMFPSRSASGKSGGSAKSITSAYSYSRGRGLLKADALMSAMDQQQARDSAPQMNPYAMQMTSGGYGSSAMGQQMSSGPSRGREPRRSPRDGAGGASRAGNAMSEFEAALFGGGSRDRLAASSRSQGRTTGGGTGYNDNGPMSPNQFMFLPEAGASSASSRACEASES